MDFELGKFRRVGNRLLSVGIAISAVLKALGSASLWSVLGGLFLWSDREKMANRACESAI